MGWQGYTELLCERGHYQTLHGREGRSTCEFCGQAIVHSHTVDTTNGYRVEHPDCCDGPKTEIGFDDLWNYDHYGNRYATKRICFAPDMSVWKDIAAERKKIEEENRLNKENERYSIQVIDLQGGVWQMLNEFDAETRTFKFLDEVKDVSLVHEFKSIEDAQNALLIIAPAINVAREDQGLPPARVEVCRYDIRTF